MLKDEMRVMFLLYKKQKKFLMSYMYQQIKNICCVNVIIVYNGVYKEDNLQENNQCKKKMEYDIYYFNSFFQ